MARFPRNLFSVSRHTSMLTKNVATARGATTGTGMAAVLQHYTGKASR